MSDYQLIVIRRLLELLFALSGIAVGCGVYLEQEKFTKAKQKLGWRLVVGGIAFETAFSVFIFLADSEANRRTLDALSHAQIEAANADLEAGKLGVSVTNLTDFVNTQTAKVKIITSEFSDAMTNAADRSRQSQILMSHISRSARYKRLEPVLTNEISQYQRMMDYVISNILSRCQLTERCDIEQDFRSLLDLRLAFDEMSREIGAPKINLDDTCSYDMTLQYAEEAKIKSLPAQHEYRKLKATYSCVSNHLQKELQDLRATIAADDEAIANYGKDGPR